MVVKPVLSEDAESVEEEDEEPELCAEAVLVKVEVCVVVLPRVSVVV